MVSRWHCKDCNVDFPARSAYRKHRRELHKRGGPKGGMADSQRPLQRRRIDERTDPNPSAPLQHHIPQPTEKVTESAAMPLPMQQNRQAQMQAQMQAQFMYESNRSERPQPTALPCNAVSEDTAKQHPDSEAVLAHRQMQMLQLQKQTQLIRQYLQVAHNQLAVAQQGTSAQHKAQQGAYIDYIMSLRQRYAQLQQAAQTIAASVAAERAPVSAEV